MIWLSLACSDKLTNPKIIGAVNVVLYLKILVVWLLLSDALDSIYSEFLNPEQEVFTSILILY